MDKRTVTVLLVDDDANYTSIIHQFLKRFQDVDFKVIEVQQSNQVLEQLHGNPSIDVILMDYYLPDVSGLDLTKLIVEENIQVPIIFLTANKDFRVAIEALKFGAEEYLLKALKKEPDNYDFLYAICTFYLENRQNSKAKVYAHQIVSKYPSNPAGNQLLQLTLK